MWYDFFPLFADSHYITLSYFSDRSFKIMATNCSDDEKKTEPEDYLFVAALDFGTTYSGYAFSSRSDHREDPMKIQANQSWNAGGSSLFSLKTPTSLLLNSKGEFVSFGYEAENKYGSLVLDGDSSHYLFFSRFKMKLHTRDVSNKLNEL
jgi:hypothetical protein